MYEQLRARERGDDSDRWLQTPAPAVIPGKHTLSEPHALFLGDASPEAATTPAVGHESHKIKLEIGHGTVTGGLTVTFETGTAGIPLGDDRLKALKSSATLKLNDFATKLETTLLSGKLGTELDGIKVAIDTNVLKVSSDGEDISKQLMTVALKVEGDASHFFGVERPVTAKLEGDLQIALGGKLAAKLTDFAVAELEEVSFAKEIEAAGGEFAEHARALEELEARRATTAAGKLAELEGQIFERRVLMMGKQQVVEDLALRLAASRSTTRRALYKIEGALAKTVARAMEKRAVKFAAQALARVIPVLNIAMLALDAVELIQLLRMLWSHYNSEGGGGGEGDGKAAGSAANAKGAKSDGGEGGSGQGNAAGVEDRRRSMDEALARLSPAARSITNEIAQKGRNGVKLSPDHVQMIGMLAARLSPSEAELVVTMLREDSAGPRATTPEDVIESLDEIVRGIRNNSRVVTVDGKRRPELTSHDGPATSPSQVAEEESSQPQGPITSPSQVRGKNEVAAPRWPQKQSKPAPADLAAIVYAAPPEVVARWFMIDRGELLMSGEGARWRAANMNKKIRTDEKLLRLDFQPTRLGTDAWELAVTFRVDVRGTMRQVDYTFCANAASDGRGVVLERCMFMEVR